jgi:hypothetical protein
MKWGTPYDGGQSWLRSFSAARNQRMIVLKASTPAAAGRVRPTALLEGA